ncbi:MAG: hypothetical protein ABIE23_05060 [archaeon]
MKESKISVMFRMLAFFAAFGVVVYAMLVLNDYLGDFRNLYFLLGNWGDAIGLAIFILGISFILRYLLLWQYRKSAGIKRRKRK